MESSQAYKCLHQLKADGSPRVTFSKNGKTLLTGSNRKIELRDTTTGACLQEFKLDKTCKGISFSPTSDNIIYAVTEEGISEFEISSGNLLRFTEDFPKGDFGARSLAISPNGAVLATGTNEGKLLLWDAKTFKQINQLEGHDLGQWVTALEFSPKGDLLASTGQDLLVRVWEVSTGKMVSEFTEEGDFSGTNFTFLGEENKIAVGFLNGLRVFDASTGKKLTSFDDAKGSSKLVAKGGKLITFSTFDLNADSTLHLWNLADGKLLHKFEKMPGFTYSVDITEDGKFVAAGDIDTNILIYSRG